MSDNDVEVMGRAAELLERLRKRGLDPDEFEELRRLQTMCPHNANRQAFMHNGEDCEVCGMNLSVLMEGA